MNSIEEPKLAPPGAGLPKPELFIARLIFALQYRKGNRAVFNARFAEEREIVRRLAPAETVRILVNDDASEKRARRLLAKYGTTAEFVQHRSFRICPDAATADFVVGHGRGTV